MRNDIQKLNALAALITPHATLYAVGGFVRDKMLDCESYDLDICSKLEVKDIKNVLLNTDFAVSDKNLRMGTVLITTDNFVAEYTTFRTDSYDCSRGVHKPSEVVFTDDIVKDALRRDFKCNAVYWDILRNEIVDPLNGTEDIRRRILSTTDNPHTVFEADGLRILRLIRFASELGFDIEPQTLQVACENAWRVKDIAVERIRDELCRIFTADTVHPELQLEKAHLKGLRLLDDFGLIDLLLPELSQLKGLEQKKKYHLYDAYEHSIKAYELAPPQLRWTALLHDVGKRTAYRNNNGENMRGHDEIGAQMADGLFARLKFSNADRKRTVKIIRKHMVDIKGDTSFNKLRKFVVENSDIIDDVCAIKDIDAEASCGHKPDFNRVRDAWEEVKRDGTPLCVKDLKVDGNDLIKLGVESKDIGRILNELFEDTVLNRNLNDRDKALEYVGRKRDKLVGKR